MKSLIRFGVEQHVLMNIAFIGIMLFAVMVAIPGLPMDRFPNISFREASIVTNYEGASAEDVERLVTKPIEDALRGMDSLDYVLSSSIQGISAVDVKFREDSDWKRGYSELRFRVLAMQHKLPMQNGEHLRPLFEDLTTDIWLPTVQISMVSSDQQHPIPMRTLELLAKDLRTRLERIAKVKRVALAGARPDQFDLALDPDKMRRSGVTTEMVASALMRSGQSLPGGSTDSGGVHHLIRIDNQFRSRDDVFQVVVRVDGDGNVLRVGDLADLRVSGTAPMSSGVRWSLNGYECVILQVVKEADGNANTIKEAVAKEIAEFKEVHRGDGVTAVISLDTTKAIADSLGLLQSNIVQGLVLVTILLTVFLGFKSSFLAILGVIFPFLGATIYFWMTSTSINELTLLGFLVVEGMLADDAIVVLDNIQQHRERGEPVKDAVINGISEVFWPVVSSTATTVSSFLPLLLMTGMVGDFFSLIPIAVTVCLLVSLAEALLMLPLHILDLEKLWPTPVKNKAKMIREGEVVADERMEEFYLSRPGFIGWMARRYDRIVRFNLQRPYLTLLITLGLFLGAIGVLFESYKGPQWGWHPLLKLDFFPSDVSTFEVRIRMPDGSSIDDTERTLHQIEARLADRGKSQVMNVSGMAGALFDTTYKPVWSASNAYMQIELPPLSERSFNNTEDFLATIRKDLEDTFEKNGTQLDVGGMKSGPPTEPPLNLRISGIDYMMARRLANDLKGWLAEQTQEGKPLHGVIDISDDSRNANRVLSFTVNRTAVALHGLDEGSVNRYVAAAFDGIYVGTYRRGEDDIPLRLKLRSAVGTAAERLGDVPLMDSPSGKLLRFSDVGSMSQALEPVSIVRRDFARTTTLSGNIAEWAAIGPNHVTDAVKQWYREHELEYPGATVAFGGLVENTGRSYLSLAEAFLFSIIIIYTILAMQFQSYLQPILIMSNIIFSFTGVVLVMGLFGFGVMLLPHGWVRPERTLFTVQSFIAIVALTGMVVKEAIVLMDCINVHRRNGMSLEDALRRAAHQRMRAVFLTTMTTIGGMLTMAIGIPSFSITWSPMATCFVAGLSMSTALTLLVVPVLYLVLERARVGILETMRQRIAHAVISFRERQLHRSMAKARRDEDENAEEPEEDGPRAEQHEEEFVESEEDDQREEIVDDAEDAPVRGAASRMLPPSRRPQVRRRQR